MLHRNMRQGHAQIGVSPAPRQGPMKAARAGWETGPRAWTRWT